MRLLAITDFSELATGYGVYCKELLTGLQARGHEVIELACGCIENDPKLNNVKWEVIANQPSPSNTRAKEAFDTLPLAEYGAWQFEDLCITYKPDVVLLFRDIWFDEFVLRSPLRDYFAVVCMPAIDAEPQNKNWLRVYEKADSVLCYTEWGLNLMRNSGYNIPVYKTAPPVAPKEFVRLPNKERFKQALNLGDIRIAGFVGRNQRRKLFPELYSAFAQYLKEEPDSNVFLYSHTSYPDRGWELDEEISKYGISNRVLFTYICQNCRFIEPSLFRGPASYCARCQYQNSMVLARGDVSLTNTEMCKIYNLFDLYIQYAQNEGYGMPLAEAAACGVPGIAVDYSAMSEVCKLINGKLIPVKAFHQELETGRKFAIPDNQVLVQYLKDFFNRPYQMQDRDGILARIEYNKNWQFENTINAWDEAIKLVKPKLPWNNPPRIYPIPDNMIQNVDNTNFAKWLIGGVLRQPELLGSDMELRLIRDLNNQATPGGCGGQYYHEHNGVMVDHRLVNHLEKFNRELAFNVFRNMLAIRNKWEELRVQRCQ